MAHIKKHKTAVVTAPWDGAKAVMEASTVQTLTHMHAYVHDLREAGKRDNYLFAHHEAGTDTPANLAAVNLALARLSEARLPELDKLAVAAHLRAHRADAGLPEAMSEAEIAEAVKHIKSVDDLKAQEAKALTDAIALQERSNLAEWLESRLHLHLTQIADDLFGGGTVNRSERKLLSGAIGAALDVYHQHLADNAPQLFQRRPWEDAPDDSDQPVAEALDLREAGDGMFMPLVEKAVRRDGTIPIKIIQPGWGSSGYYPAEVLERDGPRIFQKGMHMYWNHPTQTEESERPERDLNDLAAVFVSDSRWDANGPKGPGLYADAKVFENYRQPVDNMAEHIGVSIRAMGKAQQGTIEGRTGPIITELTAGRSTDFVTAPGAGGEILSLFEAARTVRTGQNPGAGTVPASAATDSVAITESTSEVDMELNELKEAVTTLQTQNSALTAANARLIERMAMRDARELVQEALSSLQLPQSTRARLLGSLPAQAVIKEGELDRAAFLALVSEAVKAEVKYLTESLGLGTIKGLGESGDDELEDEVNAEEALSEAFASMGLSETAVKHAAKGRE